ncbi:MAG: SDR family oxidoreductase [Bacteroidota bacterium]
MSANHKVFWITGASSGIGEALAYEASANGATVILSARRKEELERVASGCSGETKVVPLDLTDQESLKKAAAEVLSAYEVDVLINNGGISMRGRAHETDFSVDRRLMEIDYFGHVALTKLVLPQMIKRGKGHLVAISSVVGRFGFPMRSAYSAAKHALNGFFETVGLELYDKGVNVTIVNPGRIKTQISLNALNNDGSTYGKMDKGQEEGIPADVCAKKILKAVAKGKREINIGNKEVLLLQIRRFFPTLFFKIARKVSPT